jgi:putative sterol carrier protein
LSLYPSVITRAIIPLGLIVGFGTPFSRKYPDRYLKKLGLPPLAEQRKIDEDMKGLLKSTKEPREGLDTAWAAVAGMADSFKAEAAGDMDAVIKFQVTGNEEFQICLEIKNGECRQREHPSRDPDLVINTPADVWLSIARGEKDGSSAFAEKEYTVSGDLSLLLKMDYIFG